MHEERMPDIIHNPDETDFGKLGEHDYQVVFPLNWTSGYSRVL